MFSNDNLLSSISLMIPEDLEYLLFGEVSLIYIHLEHYEVAIEKCLSQLMNVRPSKKYCYVLHCPFYSFYIQINFLEEDVVAEASPTTYWNALEAPAIYLQ